MPDRILIAGVGYTYLRDWSVGPVLAAQLRQRAWPEGIEIDDWSFGPLDAAQWLRDAEPAYARAVFFGASDRGEPPGTVRRRVWQASDLPPLEVVQERIGEAISGVISLDNLVFVCAALGALPPQVVLLEVEPAAEQEWGEEFSPEVTAALPELVRYIESEAGMVGSSV
ncbi:MAG: hydrogenase maturation protease [Candidatus Dormibacteria bacterium]